MSSGSSADGRPRAAATIGVFDGVHRGHQALIAQVVRAARRVGGIPVAVTFSRHPLAVLAPERCPPPVTTVSERQALIMAHDIAEVVALDFDREMSRLSARAFLDKVLLSRYDLKVLVVGPDFAMGQDRQGDLEALEALGAELGFTVEVVAPVSGRGGPVSSTRLRQAIAAGEVVVARDLLGRSYEIGGSVTTGFGRGRGLGFPTANLRVDPGKMLPADGVYAVQVRLGPGGHQGDPASPDWRSGEWRTGVVNIGLAPTFAVGERRVEVHILDFAGDLGGRRLVIRFLARIRGEQRFPDASALKAQITADVATARAIAAAEPGSIVTET